ncbi:MAG TPA: hypothetical protein VGX03_36810 [Candidatus Binatia bacterium]|jgi:hypothetical protein|nr:hypothetical protein [Candidatus Binatia bacterium]
MSFLLVPHSVTSSSAVIWVAAINEAFDPATAVLHGNGETHPFDQGVVWTSRNGTYTAQHQSITLQDLQSRRLYELELQVQNMVVAHGSVTTLPDHLPTVGEPPFTVLLGSCFCRLQDEAGNVGNTFSGLPVGQRPELKIFCGDQVYLDAQLNLPSRWPWPHTTSELEALFFENYLETWTQGGSPEGFRALLRQGANYFISDDHEFWNNAPNFAPLIPETWSEQGKREWKKVALSLFRLFQTSTSTAQLSVGSLSFLLIDTRINRDADERNFMARDDGKTLKDWVQGLTAPGVLVLGQPLFAEQRGLLGHAIDWGLPDYRQYANLARILTASQKSILILTGDIHCSRIAHCRLPSQAELVEVISSPLALVDQSVGGQRRQAPPRFPSFAIPGIGGMSVTTEFCEADNHFLTLEFAAQGNEIQVRIFYWPVSGGNAREIFQCKLQ